MQRRLAVLIGFVLGSLGQAPTQGQSASVGPRSAQGQTASDSDAAAHAPRLVIIGPSDQLLTRVEGQLSDLDVEVRVEPAPASGTDLEAAAPRLARAHGAQWLVWTQGQPGSGAREGNTICIWSNGSAEVFCRRIDSEDTVLEPGDSSASYELAALSVRSAVRARLIALAETQARPAQAPPQPVNPTPPVEPPPADPEPAAAAKVRPTRLWVLVGADWFWDGADSFGRPALDLGLELDVDRLQLGLGGSIATLAEINLQQVEVRSRRVTAAAGVGWFFGDAEGFGLLPRAHAGALWTMRSSVAEGSAEATAAATSAGPYVGFGLRAQSQLGQRFALGLSAGVDWVPRPTDWVVLDDTGRAAHVRRTWHAQPSAGVMFRAAFW